MQVEKEAHQYDDIIGLPHPEPKTHPRMAMQDRAAQFASFAALKGFRNAIEETAKNAETEQESR